MSQSLTIVFAYRNRNLDRIRLVMDSLKMQSDLNFSVIFVDYGSDETYSQPLKYLIESYDFASYFYVGHPGLLWNKSKAYNYAIKKADTSYILTADVDLVFNPKTIESLKKLCEKNSFTLFKYGYLPEKLKISDIKEKGFSELKPAHYGDVNGVGLYPRAALMQVHGFDEFYHFYGAEDEDLFLRLENSGLNRKREDKLFFLHIWHSRYPFKDDNSLTRFPRLKNAMRLNQQHLFFCKSSETKIPRLQNTWGNCFQKQDQDILSKPSIKHSIYNSSAAVDHFFNEYLPSRTGDIVLVQITEDPEVYSLKGKLKRLTGKIKQSYFNLKEVNDLILRRIVFNYRHHNYEFKISEDLKMISFVVDLRKNN